MPTTLIALPRGINVGKAKRIAMADFRDLLADLGYRNPRTLLNSGNAVFNARSSDASAASRKIEKGLVDALGVSARVMVITGEELAEIIRKNPLTNVAHNHSRMMVGVLDPTVDKALLTPIKKAAWSPEAFALGTRAVYYWCPDSILESPLGNAVAKVLKDRVTTRNWATMLKLQVAATEVAASGG